MTFSFPLGNFCFELLAVLHEYQTMESRAWHKHFDLHSAQRRLCNLFVHECMGGTSYLANVNLSIIVAVTYHSRLSCKISNYEGE